MEPVNDTHMKTRSQKLLEFLSLERSADRLLAFEVPKDALTWTRFCGSLLLVLIILLFLSGTFMAFYYSPVPGTAYDSVDFALFNIPFGSVVKGIHHYSWNLLLMAMGIHLGRSLILGSYKVPRQMVWVTGVIILFFVPLFIITGDLLPWDQKGYWSTQVRLSIISSVPFVGNIAERFLLGGSLTGVVAITRFYVLHILFLPGLLVLFIAVHFHFIRHRGLAEPLGADPVSRPRIPFYPNIVNRWLFLFIMVSVILGIISWHWWPPLGDPADPTDSSYIPKPEWWVLFLNQLVSVFKGGLAVLGSTIIPAGLAGLLLGLPFMDRSPHRHLAGRWKILLPAAIIFIFIIVLSIMGYMEHFVLVEH